MWLLQCTKVEPGQPCPVVPFTNVITLEKLVIFMKGLQMSNAVSMHYLLIEMEKIIY